jgi:hypothetical protein
MSRRYRQEAIFLLFAIIGIAVITLVRCSNDDFFGGSGGVPQLAQGFLVDNNGNPISGATLYIQGTGVNLSQITQIQSDPIGFTTGDGLTCDDALDPDTLEPLTEVSGIDCTDAQGSFVLSCQGTGTVLIVVLLDDGTLTGIEVVCGGPPVTVTPDGTLISTPTPTPSASP